MVAVELPAGSQQQVTPVHGHRVAVDHGPHALTLQDEAEGVLAVAVVGGGLSRAQVLDRGPQGGCGVGESWQAGMGYGDGAALSAAADGYQLPGAGGRRVQVVPVPHVRPCFRGGPHRHQVFASCPQRDEAVCVEVLVQLLFGGRALGGG